MNGQRGFTLVELLVASAILVVLGVAGYVGLDIVLGSAERVEAEGRRLNALQRCFTQLAMDLEQVVGRPVRDDFGEPRAALLLDSGVNALEFTRGGLPNPAGWARSSLQRVAYSHEEGKLWRQYWTELDRLQGSGVVRRILLDAVSGVEYRFLDEAREWHDQWPPLRGGAEGSGQVPVAVEIKLELEDWGELRRVYALPG